MVTVVTENIFFHYQTEIMPQETYLDPSFATS